MSTTLGSLLLKVTLATDVFGHHLIHRLHDVSRLIAGQLLPVAAGKEDENRGIVGQVRAENIDSFVIRVAVREPEACRNGPTPDSAALLRDDPDVFLDHRVARHPVAVLARAVQLVQILHVDSFSDKVNPKIVGSNHRHLKWPGPARLTLLTLVVMSPATI